MTSTGGLKPSLVSVSKLRAIQCDLFSFLDLAELEVTSGAARYLVAKGIPPGTDSANYRWNSAQYRRLERGALQLFYRLLKAAKPDTIIVAPLPGESWTNREQQKQCASDPWFRQFTERFVRPLRLPNGFRGGVAYSSLVAAWHDLDFLMTLNFRHLNRGSLYLLLLGPSPLVCYANHHLQLAVYGPSSGSLESLIRSMRRTTVFTSRGSNLAADH